jgi:hypothetical protein
MKLVGESQMEVKLRDTNYELRLNEMLWNENC